MKFKERGGNAGSRGSERELRVGVKRGLNARWSGLPLPQVGPRCYGGKFSLHLMFHGF